jgi:parafibromin
MSDDSPNGEPSSFFDNNSAGNETRPDLETSPPSTSAGSCLEMRSRNKEAQPSEEWRAAVNPARLAAVTAAKDIAKKQQAQFELNLPEHLPSSPLCPKNPMHKSKGLGICVYHGRTRAANLTREGDEGEMSGQFGWT